MVLEKLPVEYDSRVKGFEVDEKPTEQYSDIGGLGEWSDWLEKTRLIQKHFLDKQIQELVEAIVLPIVSYF